MKTQAIQLGSFELHEVIGRGGMGHVWRATHAHQGVEVALKVMTSSRARKRHAVEAFRNEVHAMARLDHPGIVMVLDVGEVDEAAAEAGAGTLTAGSPFLAMELATHGTLDRVREGLHWRRLRAVMLSILDALAHAHARGVIHRDLKPGNVLATTDHRGKPVLKLADFGLAHALHTPRDRTEERKVSGTPKYMAPEQIEGRLRDQGPWTDLYALGCLAHWLLTGTPPYVGELDDILTGHLFEEPPELEDLCGAPPSFRDWLSRLLQKAPRDRFRSAADAAYGLMMLDDTPLGTLEGFGEGLGEITDTKWTEPELSVLDQTIVVENSAATRPGSRSSKPLGGFSATVFDADFGAETERVSTGPIDFAPRPPPPRSWRRAEQKQRSMRLVGAGLGLYGLRPIPMVDREAERNTLWEAVHEIHDDHDLRVNVLIGAAGSGKSRLADWLCERTLEVGAAIALRAVHTPEHGLGDGLARMVAEHLRCVGLDREAVFSRVQDFYFSSGAVNGQDVYDCAAITEMIAPDEASEGVVRFTKPIERYIVLARFLERLSHERPLVVWLDDVQWGLDALDFVSYFLSTGRRTPVLFVLTVREEALVEDALESERLLELADDAHTRVVEVEPLAAEHHTRLVEELLSLEPKLAEQVAERTAGNPLFAVQLVGDWVQRGLLEVRDEGFAIADPSAIDLPDSIHEMWLDRLQGFVDVQGLSELEARQIELAAILGTEVDDQEWRAACKSLDNIEPGADLVSRLVEDGLVRAHRHGFAFSHGMLQESLARLASEEFRAASYHRAAASMLRQLHDMRRPEMLERYGTHLHGAGDWEAALEPLLEAARVFGERSEFERAKRLVKTRESALDAIGASENDERRGEGWHVVIRCLLRQGLVDEAGTLIELGVEKSREHDWATMRPEFELHLGSLARKRGDSEEAVNQYRRALDLFDEENINGRAKCLYGIGEVLLYRGELETAVEYLERSLEKMQQHDMDEAGVVLTGLASAQIRVDEFDVARGTLGLAVEAFRRVRNRGGRAAALNMLGELERARGELMLAEQAYREAIDVLESIGSRGVTIPRLNLGLVYLARSRWSSARETLSIGMEELLEVGEMSHVGFVHLAIACASAGEGDWDSFDEHLSQSREILDESAWVDRDIAHHAELAASLAEAAGERERAEAAAKLAEEQWAALGERPPT